MDENNHLEHLSLNICRVCGSTDSTWQFWGFLLPLTCSASHYTWRPLFTQRFFWHLLFCLFKPNSNVTTSMNVEFYNNEFCNFYLTFISFQGWIAKFSDPGRPPNYICASSGFLQQFNNIIITLMTPLRYLRMLCECGHRVLMISCIIDFQFSCGSKGKVQLFWVLFSTPIDGKSRSLYPLPDASQAHLLQLWPGSIDCLFSVIKERV